MVVRSSRKRELLEHAQSYSVIRAEEWAGTKKSIADVIAEHSGKRIVVQCKFYSKPVGNKAVQEVVAAKQFVGADLAVVASNQSFTKSAQQLAAANSVYLLHHDQLATVSARIRH